jgi:hypothetical protein
VKGSTNDHVVYAICLEFGHSKALFLYPKV